MSSLHQSIKQMSNITKFRFVITDMPRAQIEGLNYAMVIDNKSHIQTPAYQWITT